MKQKALIILSGGLDSAVVLAAATDGGYECEAVSFNYGQRHKRELISAAKLCEYYGIRHHIINLPFLQNISDSALTGGKEIPHGHYEAESMKDTVVSGRNLIFASIALSLCVKIDADSLYLGIHAGDHAIYYDCRPEFYRALQEVAYNFDEKCVRIEAPFIMSTKKDIVLYGNHLGVPFELTWTCYEGKNKPCGKCGSCQERLEAFAANDLTDPLEYESNE